MSTVAPTTIAPAASRTETRIASYLLAEYLERLGVEVIFGLCGHTVAVEKGTTQLDDSTAQSKKCTDAGKPAVKVSAFPDQNGANLALSSGRAEVGMADSPVAAYQVKLSNGQFMLSGQPYGVAPYGIAVARLLFHTI